MPCLSDGTRSRSGDIEPELKAHHGFVLRSAAQTDIPRRGTGRNSLTCAAKLALHTGVPARAAQAVDQLDELEQVGNPQRAAPGGPRHEHIDVSRVSPAARQRALHTLLIKEEHAVLTPRLADRDEHELPPERRMKRMRHTDSSLLIDRIGRS